MTTRYVMPDREMAIGKFYAMTAWSDILFSKYAVDHTNNKGITWCPSSSTCSLTSRRWWLDSELFDGTETPIGDAVALAYRPMQMQDGSTVPVMTDQPKISNNYTELEEYVNASRSKGDLAMIASRDQLTPCVPLEALKHYRLVHESEND